MILEHVRIVRKGVRDTAKWRERRSGAAFDLSDASLAYATLQKRDLSWANLAGADLSYANLYGANLNYANLTGANLTRANLTGASLYAADVSRANLSDIEMTKADSSRPFALESGSFLDLATCKGLATAQFSTPDFFANYIADAFEYAHRSDIPEIRLGGFVADAVRRIQVLRALYAEDEISPGLLKIVQSITSDLIRQLKQHPELLYEMKSRQFEELIAELLAHYGWQVKLTQATRDGGYDIFAITQDISGVTSSWIIECKKNAQHRTVGIDVVRGLYGVKADLRVANAMLATTSYFSKGVHDYKASRYDLELQDYQGLLDWINEYKPNPNGRLYMCNSKLVLPGEEGFTT